jgi:hypothetical protein
VTEFVTDLLAWNAQVERIERSQRGSNSPLHGDLVALQLGVLGSGCSGTKTPGRPAPPERDAGSVDPILTFRYQRLRGEALRVADIVLADGRGVQNTIERAEKREHELTLEQRVGLRVSDDDRARKWYAKLVEGDSVPALTGMRVRGEAALALAAGAWWVPIV